MTKRFNEENAVGDVLKHFIQQNKLQAGIDKVDVREAWKNLMGPGVNNYTTEIRLKNDVLYVALSSAVLREELSYGKAKIIVMINDALRKEVVKDLILQ